MSNDFFSLSDADKTNEILQALENRASRLIWASELILGPKRRRIDFWTISPHPGKAYKATAFEIKVSRADFRRDTYDKQRMARLFCDEFYYVAPKGLLAKDDIPDWAGLQEFDGKRFSYTVHAPMRDKDAPSWELLTSILRYSGQTRRDTDIVRNDLAIAQSQLERLRHLLSERTSERLLLLKQVRELESRLREAGINTQEEPK